MVELPVLTGGVKVIVACPLPAVALTPVGASGTNAGVAELEALDALLVPIAFVAVTLKVYAWPLVRPTIVMGDEPPVAVNPPTFEVTVYEVIAEPPLFMGGVKVTTACPLPRVAVPMVGASGTVAGTTELLVPEPVLVPIALLAVTVKV